MEGTFLGGTTMPQRVQPPSPRGDLTMMMMMMMAVVYHADDEGEAPGSSSKCAGEIEWGLRRSSNHQAFFSSQGNDGREGRLSRVSAPHLNPSAVTQT